MTDMDFFSELKELYNGAKSAGVFSNEETKAIDAAMNRLSIKLGFKKPMKKYEFDEYKPKVSKTKRKAPTIVYGDPAEIEGGGEIHYAKYGIIELSDIIPSHNWFNYSKNENYPPECQERQYHDNKQLQANVEMRSQNFKPKHLLTEDLTAESGPSIMNPDGIVLGGNSRVMILGRVKEHYPNSWKAYQDFLYSRAKNFGIEREQLDMFENPVLARIIKVNMEDCSHYSWVFNTSTKNETDS